MFFQLIASRYETGSVIVTSYLEFSRWGEALGDDVVAAATIDRLVHHAHVIPLDGDADHTRAHRARPPLAAPKTTKYPSKTEPRGSKFNRQQGVKVRPTLTHVSAAAAQHENHGFSGSGTASQQTSEEPATNLIRAPGTTMIQQRFQEPAGAEPCARAPRRGRLTPSRGTCNEAVTGARAPNPGSTVCHETRTRWLPNRGNKAL